ncbi:hypothetical protein [Kibdelosporangium phytohabitans]|uniref:hypothetical protein n=1 Tax=Kibdelosporangium phytohabitans TaxID=860235 RepID=UPI0019FE1355|nr:hypothetical protein [Kibdelosporangium phytohabitans]MBE1470586.1 hypothetical protein [Kibdelosporangium phytohabitans]
MTAGTGVTTIAVIDRTYNGPPNSAQGGYACAVFAKAALGHNAAAVTLLKPPPLDTPCEVTPGPKRAMVRANGTLVATVCPIGREPDEVMPVNADTARQAAAGFRGRADHPFPTCYVCGHDRVDGLHLTPGPVPDRPGTAACLWTPREPVTEEIVWGVLDCPGGWTYPEPAVLSRMCAVMAGPIRAGVPHVVTAVRRSSRDRTITVGTSVHTTSGQLVAKASAVWTAIPGGLPGGD